MKGCLGMGRADGLYLLLVFGVFGCEYGGVWIVLYCKNSADVDQIH